MVHEPTPVDSRALQQSNSRFNAQHLPKRRCADCGLHEGRQGSLTYLVVCLSFMVHNAQFAWSNVHTHTQNYSDALTATVPLWCAVINAVCLEVEGASSKWLFTPPWVSASEHAQMAARVQETVSCMASTQRALIRQHGKALRGPLVPLWVRPGPGSDSPLVTTAARGGERGEPPPAALLPSGSVCRDGVPPLLEGDLGYVPVLCVSASRSISDDRHRQQHRSASVVTVSGGLHAPQKATIIWC